jgi:prolyl oligopeptidase
VDAHVLHANSALKHLTQVDQARNGNHGYDGAVGERKGDDPYRWLEDGASEKVQAWTAGQNAQVRALLDAEPGRDELRAELERLLSIGWVDLPVPVTTERNGQRRTRYFFERRGQGDEQPALCLQDHQGERVLVDPAALAADGTAALDWWFPSPDGSYVAYGVSLGGNEQSTLYVLDVDQGELLGESEKITRAYFAAVAWLPDNEGFYYTRYPAEDRVPEDETLYHRKVYEHRLGRDPDEDPVVFGEGRPMTDMPSVDISPSGRWLVAAVHTGWSRREAHLLDRHQGADANWLPLAVPDHDAVYTVQPHDDWLLVRTNDGAPNYRLFLVDPEKPERQHWQLVIPESDEALVEVTRVGDVLFACYVRDAQSVIRRPSLTGALLGEIDLPGPGTVSHVSGEQQGDEGFFTFTSFVTPSQVHRVTADTGATTLWAEVASPIDSDAYETAQRWATSADGTKIPYFMVRKQDGATGPAPTLLTGYGGFNKSMMPSFSGESFVLLERGGVLVSANLRGGGEYGERWHRAGMLESKQNVFDDFIAVAERLISDGTTTRQQLAIAGGSNGGLLVGAAITQRPELFRAAVSAVPLLDMLRYDRFLLAKLWVPEYGSPDNPEHFEWLLAYSPYHRVVPETAYPATLLLTAEGDSRVDPMHARKMAARLQAATSSDQPILVRIETRAGHGAGKPVTKRVEERLDMYGFLFRELSVQA